MYRCGHSSHVVHTLLMSPSGYYNESSLFLERRIKKSSKRLLYTLLKSLISDFTGCYCCYVVTRSEDGQSEESRMMQFSLHAAASSLLLFTGN